MKLFGKKQDTAAVLLSNDQIACGIVLHPVTKKWQTWVSLHGIDITCLTAHNKREDADKVARQIVAAWEKGLDNQSQVKAFFQSLPSDDVVDPLPHEVVMRLSRKIKKK